LRALRVFTPVDFGCTVAAALILFFHDVFHYQVSQVANFGH
jgi:hypothetical protein